MAASGDLAAYYRRTRKPATDGARLVGVTGGSTPPEEWEVWAFQGTGDDEFLDFEFLLAPNYVNEDIIVRTFWWLPTATASNASWGAGFRDMKNQATDQVTDSHTYAFKETTYAAPGTTYTMVKSEVTIGTADTNEYDTISGGQGLFLCRIRRDPDHASDGVTTDAHLVGQPTLIVA